MKIALKDGSVKEYAGEMSVIDIAARNAHSAACFIVGGNGATGLYWSHSELVFTGLI